MEGQRDEKLVKMVNLRTLTYPPSGKRPLRPHRESWKPLNNWLGWGTDGSDDPVNESVMGGNASVWGTLEQGVFGQVGKNMRKND